VADQYTRIRRLYPSLARADALIAATALARKIPLLTFNYRHFRSIQGLRLLPTRNIEGTDALDRIASGLR
jgi:hypothetical protein